MEPFTIGSAAKEYPLPVLLKVFMSRMQLRILILVTWAGLFKAGLR